MLFEPFFSIITVTYNNLQGIIVTSKSISSQECKDFEWLVIDGGSIDGTQDFIIATRTLITNWISEKDLGIYDAMNKGIKLSTGKYSVFLNAGDVFTDDTTLQKVKNIITSSSELPDMLLGGAVFVLQNGVNLYREPRDISKYIWHGVPANHQATYFRNEILKNTLYDIRYKICGDYYLMAMFYLKGKYFAYLNESLVSFQVNGTSYKNPVLLWQESYLIKIKVLKLPLIIRIKSLAKSIISTLAMIVVSQPSFRWLAKYIKKATQN